MSGYFEENRDSLCIPTIPSPKEAIAWLKSAWNESITIPDPPKEVRIRRIFSDSSEELRNIIQQHTESKKRGSV